MLGQAFGVKTSGGLVSPFYDSTWVYIVRILHFFDTSRVQVFEDFFLFLIPFEFIHLPKTFIAK